MIGNNYFSKDLNVSYRDICEDIKTIISILRQVNPGEELPRHLVNVMYEIRESLHVLYTFENKFSNIPGNISDFGNTSIITLVGVEKLKKCPFCGGESIFVIQDAQCTMEGSLILYLKVACKDCNFSTPETYSLQVSLSPEGELIIACDERNKAIERWNKRCH